MAFLEVPISLLDRPIGSAHGPADAIRQPAVAPDRDVRPFQGVLIALGAQLALPGFVNEDGGAKYPGGYADYIVNHQRAPGIGPLAGWRGTDGKDQGRGEPNPDQLQSYIANGCFWKYELPPEQQYYKHANADYLAYANSMGWTPNTDPIVFQMYAEPLQKFRLAARGHGDHLPPADHRSRIETYFDPLPIWFPPFEEAAIDSDEFPLHALTQRPMTMYHSWGSHNAWLRQIHGCNRLYVNRRTAARLGLSDDDWVRIESHHASVKAQIQTMEGCNADTVWTWNSIGKRRDAWNLDPNAPEATKGFLLNHVISELLPPGARRRYANADPVTGQAAWFALRVRLVKCTADEAAETEPMFDTLPPRTDAARPRRLRYGVRFRRGASAKP